MAKKETTQHVKFKKARLRLGISTPLLLGHLEMLWQQAAITANPVMARGDVEAIAEWEGEPNKLIETLIDTNWIDVVDDANVQIHDYWEHAPNYVVGSFVKKHGYNPKTGPKVEPKVAPKVTPKISPKVEPKVATPILSYPILSYPIPSNPIQTPKESCAELEDPSSTPSPISSRVLLSFPCTGQQPEWSLTEPFVEKLSTAYDTIDVLSEARRALMWIESNMGRRKTARGMPRFLNSWMSRAVNSGSVNQAHRPTAQRPLPTPEPDKPPLRERIRRYMAKNPDDPDDYIFDQIADPWEISEFREIMQSMREHTAATRGPGNVTRLGSLLPTPKTVTTE